MTNPTTGNEQKALAALRYYRHECSGAEPSISVFHQMVDEALAAPVQANAPGLIAAAEHLERQADLYAQDHASNEPDTGAVVFHRGEAGREYHSTLVELAEELRGLAHEVPVLPAAPVQAVPAPAAVALTDALRDLIEAIEYTPLGLRQIKALERAREAIAASPATPKAVPAGWKLVPVEPTEEMFIEGMEADCLGHPSIDDESHVSSIWNAMLKASPAAAAGPTEPEGWREQFKEQVYADLAAADNQDVPLEEYPDRILKVLDAVVGPRHPTVIKWRNDAIEACIEIAHRYGNASAYSERDMRALLAAAPATQAEMQAEPVAWLHTNKLGGVQAFTTEPPPGLKEQCQPLYTAPQAEPAAAQQFRAILHAEVHAAIDPAGDIARQESAIDTADHLLAEFNKLFPGA